MKIAIVGVGAIGGYVGIRLALAGEDVTLLARGANLKALQTQGLRLQRTDGTEESAPHMATADHGAAGQQDLVILAMKATRWPRWHDVPNSWI
jgi:2-dehydropantoate 2-reductase